MREQAGMMTGHCSGPSPRGGPGTHHRWVTGCRLGGLCPDGTFPLIKTNQAPTLRPEIHAKREHATCPRDWAHENAHGSRGPKCC